MPKYEVETKFNMVEVIASEVQIGPNGDLTFSEDRVLIRAFAARQWEEVRCIA